MIEAIAVLTLIAAAVAVALLALLLGREKHARAEHDAAARAAREELGRGLEGFSQNVSAQMGAVTTGLNARVDAFARELENFRKTLDENLGRVQAQQRLEAKETRDTLEQRLGRMQQDNAEKLEKMRQTVDEKLHATLEQRLSESFKQVSERLEQVHKGLGEMQTLAAGVGDLRKVLTNVKTRGLLGEVQLGALLEQLLTREQYDTNVATRPGSRETVEFAIRLPGQGAAEAPLWLPIDAKFPLENYQALQQAQEAADAVALEAAARALEQQVRMEARKIGEKYLEPPHTTDFALLYLPLEGLYAEVLRRPGLFESLQRDLRVTVCGPTTLSAILNALQMGFRTLAIEKRSSEVWKVLGAVKSEFGKFGEVLARTKNQLQTVANSIDAAEVRTRQIERRLKDVEVLPGPQAAGLLPERED